jgi:hypothetical protein
VQGAGEGRTEPHLRCGEGALDPATQQCAAYIPVWGEKQNTSEALPSGCVLFLEELLAALDGKEAVTWVFVNNHTLRQFGNGFWALILAKVKDRLELTTAECYFL